MIDFNLLPPGYEKKKITSRHILLIILFALLFLMILKYAFITPIQNNKEALQKLSLLEEGTTDYSHLDEALTNQKSSLSELEQRLLCFEEMKEGVPGYWKEVLETLLISLPPNAYLNHFTCDNNTIVLSGVSDNDRLSADYLRSLKDSGLFSEVSMMKIVYQQANEANFTIQCIIHSEATEAETIGVETP